MTTALVLGGGFAGTLAAVALSHHVTRVTVIDRDRFADTPAHRKGVPHASHTHVLVSGGARALEHLLPGALDALYRAGAQKIGLPQRYLALGPQGWFPRYTGQQYIMGCSRALLEWIIRTRLRDHPTIDFTEHTDVLGLTGGPDRITGARIRDRDTRDESTVEADFVVDATGRGSATPRWLTELGAPSPDELVVDPHIVYATRIYRAPAGAETFPAVNIQANPAMTTRTRCSGVLIPIEDGRWSVTLSGTTGNHPPLDDHGFTTFAANLPHPALASLLAAATPLGVAFGFRAHANRRRYYERLSPAPQRFVALGDAYATFNPVYGHGLATAARAALALRQGLHQHGLTRARPIQRAIARASADAWTMATTQDLRYPHTTGPRPHRAAHLTYRMQDWLARAAMTSPRIAAAQMDVFTLSAPPSRLLAPALLLHALRSPTRRGPHTPPFTAEERLFLSPPST